MRPVPQPAKRPRQASHQRHPNSTSKRPTPQLSSFPHLQRCASPNDPAFAAFTTPARLQVPVPFPSPVRAPFPTRRLISRPARALPNHAYRRHSCLRRRSRVILAAAGPPAPNPADRPASPRHGLCVGAGSAAAEGSCRPPFGPAQHRCIFPLHPSLPLIYGWLVTPAEQRRVKCLRA